MLKSIKLYLLIFFLSFFNFISSQLPSDLSLPEVSLGPDIISEKELEDILAQINEQDFSNFDNSSFADVFRNPAQTLELLPQPLRGEVVYAWELVGRVVGKIMNPNFMQDPMLPVLELCNLLKNNIQEAELFDAVIKVELLLGSEKFVKAVRFNLFDVELKNDLTLNFNLFQEIISKFSATLNADILKNLLILNDILLAFSQNNIDLFFNAIERYSQQERLLGKKLFVDTFEKLNKFLVSEQNQEIKQAALFFKDEILSGLEPIINAIDDSGNIDQLALSLLPFGPAGNYLLKVLKTADKTAKINPAILFGYGFYKKFLSYYVSDNKYSFKIFLSDKIISTFFLPIYVLKKISDIRKMSTNASMQEAAYAAGNLLSEISSFYLDPNFFVRKSNWPKRTFYRISTALAYYNLWIRREGSFNKTPQNINSYLESQDPNYRYWPKDFDHLKKATWFSLKDGYITLGNYLERGIYSKVDNQLLNKIENGTLGLLKPGLINFGLNTAMPILTYKYFPKNILNMDKEAVFGTEKNRFFNSEGTFSKYFINPLSFAVGYGNDLDYIYYVGNREFDKISEAQFIEGRILGYLSVNIGSFLGKKISLKLKNQFGYLLGKLIINLCENLNLFDFNSEIIALEQKGFDFKGMNETRKKFATLSELLKERLPMIFTLMQMSKNDANNDQPDDQLQLIETLSKAFFSMLIQSGAFTQAELVDFENQFKRGEISSESLDNFSQKILDNLQGAIAQKIGGFIGGFSSWAVTDMLVKKHSQDTPIYQQLMAKFSN
ncbi:MAG: hypothetical protein ABIF12_03720 [bacterium]